MKFFILRTIPVIALEETLIALILLISYSVALSSAPFELPLSMQQALIAACVLKGFVLFVTHFHRIWRTPATVGDIMALLGTNVLASAAFIAGVGLWEHRLLAPSIYVLDFLLCFMFGATVRFFSPVYREVRYRRLAPAGERTKTVLIYGAGQAGLTLLREFRANPKLGRVAGFLDDDDSKRGANLIGAPVFGMGRLAPRFVDRLRQRGVVVDEIIIAMPSATGRQMQEAAANCRAAGVPCKTIPGMTELLQRKFYSDQIRNISLNDLLGRQPVELEEDRIREGIRGRSVMVTGAAGSIGSELCRQIARFGPSRLVAFDKAESDMFRLELELAQNYPAVTLVPIIGDVCNPQAVNEAIADHDVESIFHAAAYKHVPLMESHSIEAVNNNVIGTSNVVAAAMRHHVGSFLMISTDKAVNPANIMGTTKRAAELIVSAAQKSRHNYGTKFVSVRFGNVLGSNGSVVPVFQEQIAAGGPVTVTHPEIRRYFMTIPEAVQLVLQASIMGNGGEIFVLDMGEPVRIVDLARNMIRLAGHVPGEDIEIRFVGLRPGEKLYEELISEGENILPTRMRKIRIFNGPTPDPETISNWLRVAERIVAMRSKDRVVGHLKVLVPEYDPKNEGNTAPRRHEELAAFEAQEAV